MVFQPQDSRLILRWAENVCDGIAATLNAGLVHGDIKAANVLLTGGPDEEAYISDFGCAHPANLSCAQLAQRGLT